MKENPGKKCLQWRGARGWERLTREILEDYINAWYPTYPRRTLLRDVRHLLLLPESPFRFEAFEKTWDYKTRKDIDDWKEKKMTCD